MKHVDEVERVLKRQIADPNEVKEIHDTAAKVKKDWIEPLSGGPPASTNGLIYGLVQSGKTGVLTTTAAIAADEGYKTLIVLTSDNDTLYDQTLGRIQEAMPGVDVIAKHDFKDRATFLKRIRGGVCAVVASKNGSILKTLVENFTGANLKGLTCLLIDDEADQASLNTKARKDDGTRSKINELIAKIRNYFEKNTYLQVTATPQALFLQTPKHDFRPKFTVLSHPGSDYVGGDDFFGPHSTLVKEFDIADVAALAAGGQPTPTTKAPASLLEALDTFMIAATYKRTLAVDANCAFLCHVSTRNDDHKHIVKILRKYKTELSDSIKTKNAATLGRLQKAYDALALTHPDIKKVPLADIVKKIEFYAPGTAVKLVNGQTDEDVAVRAPYNLFVGGNKLGRGVTIKNLLVSYYGRHPRKPQADTVLQHARMYGYRRGDIGLLRLFLPSELHTVFKAIHKMETGLRDLIAKKPTAEFRGVFVEGNLNPTRRNVLAPGAVGIYSAGATYNPAQVLRTSAVIPSTKEIDDLVSHVKNKTFETFKIEQIADIIERCKPDAGVAERIWDQEAVAESVRQLIKLVGAKNGYVYVDRDRDQQASRRETQGILTGGEAGHVPQDKITLFLLRTKASRGREAAWWPQIRFPEGDYAFAFAI